MAPSSLKKMSGVQERKEGNYASSEKPSWSDFTKNDLGLTLLPGSQIGIEYEERPEAAAKSSLQKPRNTRGERLERWASFEIESQAKYSNWTPAFPNKANSLSRASDTGSESSESLYVTTRTNRELPSSQIFNSQDFSSVVQYNAKSAVAAPCDEQKSRAEKLINQHSCYSPRAVKERKLGSHSFNERQDWNASKGKEGTSDIHYDRSHLHHNQSLPNINDARSAKGKEASTTVKIPSGGTGWGSGQSKPVPHRQTGRSPESDPAVPHQSPSLESRDSAFHGSVSTSVASRSPAKHQHSELKKLSVSHQSLNLSKAFTHHSPADVQSQVLKGVRNRSWTNYLPSKARLSCRANLPASSFPAAPFTPDEDHESEHLASALSMCSNLRANTNLLSTPPSPSHLKHCNLFKVLDNLLHTRILEDKVDSTYASKQSQLPRRRSASMPNLWSTRTMMNMDSVNSFGLASLPTPSREQPRSPACLLYSPSLSQCDNAWGHQSVIGSSHDSVGMSWNADKSFQQNSQVHSNLEYHNNINVSGRQNMAPSHHACPVGTQPFDYQNTSGPSASTGGLTATSEPQYTRRRLEVKSNYSHKEVKSLMFLSVKHAQILKAENANLQSTNIALRKGVENAQQENAMKTQQIHHYECTITQKDQLIEILQQQGKSLERQYKEVWDNYNQLIAALRKKNGTGNPRAIAQKLRWNHTSSSISAASQGTQSSPNAFAVYCADGAQRNESKLASTGLHRHVQPMSVPSPSEANVMDTWNRSLRQQGYTAEDHLNANRFQTVKNPAHTEKNTADASSRASVQQNFAAVSHNSGRSLHDPSIRLVQSNQSLGTTVGTITTDVKDYDRPVGQVLTERVTIDLTEDVQSPSSSASRDISVYETRQPSVKCPSDQYPTEHFVSNQCSSSPSAQNQVLQCQPLPNHDFQGTNQEAMRIQREAFARMAKKPLSWLQGEHPFRKRAKTEQRTAVPISKRAAQGHAEEHVSVADHPRAGGSALLREIATDQKPKKKAPKKTKIALTSEAKQERAKAYRKNAVDKKKREREAAKHLFQDEAISKNAMRAQKQDRRAVKEGKRQEQARKPVGEVGRQDRQKTLDCKLYDKDTNVQQAVHRGSLEQAASDDHDSLFGDDEDSQMETEESNGSPEADCGIHGDNADVEASVAAYVAEVEELFAAEEDAGTLTENGQHATLGDEHLVPAIPRGRNHGLHDFSCTSEESEEE